MTYSGQVLLAYKSGSLIHWKLEFAISSKLFLIPWGVDFDLLVCDALSIFLSSLYEYLCRWREQMLWFGEGVKSLPIALLMQSVSKPKGLPPFSWYIYLNIICSELSVFYFHFVGSEDSFTDPDFLGKEVLWWWHADAPLGGQEHGKKGEHLNVNTIPDIIAEYIWYARYYLWCTFLCMLLKYSTPAHIAS